MEMSQRIRFWYFLKIFIYLFILENGKSNLFGKKNCDKLTNMFELKKKKLKLLENHVKTLL